PSASDPRRPGRDWEADLDGAGGRFRISAGRVPASLSRRSDRCGVSSRRRPLFCDPRSSQPFWQSVDSSREALTPNRSIGGDPAAERWGKLRERSTDGRVTRGRTVNVNEAGDRTDAAGARAHADGVGQNGHLADLLRIYCLQVLSVLAGVTGGGHDRTYWTTRIRRLDDWDRYRVTHSRDNRSPAQHARATCQLRSTSTERASDRRRRPDRNSRRPAARCGCVPNVARSFQDETARGSSS